MFIHALSGIDIALWDIKGKALGIPVYKLLGGAFRNRALAYATGLYRPRVDDPISALIQEAVGYKEKGFFAMKLKIGFAAPEEDIAIISAIRDAIGYELKLMVDANCAYDAGTAIQLAKKMESYDITWFEEPVHPQDIEGYVDIRRHINIPVAGGECLGTRYDFIPLISRKAVDILQPDICIVGGFTEMQRIASIADAYHLQCYPHVWGTNIAVAAALQFYASLPNVTGKINPPEPFFEYDRSPSPIREMTTIEKFELKNSYLDIPSGPGLGITADLDYLEANSIN
jgi:D-galactarolactone cycloisomerase